MGKAIKVLSYLAKKVQHILEVTNKIHCPERMESLYVERKKIGTFNRKQVFSVLNDYTEKRTTLCCESSFCLRITTKAEVKCNVAFLTEK